MQREYRETHPRCELFNLLPKRQLSLPNHEPTWPPAAVHHIFHRGGRHDRWENLITLCSQVHSLLHEKHSQELTVACLWVKHVKGEIDWDVWDACAGKCVQGWLETLDIAKPYSAWRDKLICQS